MLILTSRATRDPVRLLDDSGWDGPCVFAVLPADRRKRRELRELEERLIVLEWLTPPASGIALLAAVAKRLGSLLSGGPRPLFYASSPVTAQEAAEAWRAGQDERRVIRADERSGELDRVLLGPEIVAHPLARDFLQTLGDLGAEDAQFLPLARSALARRLQ